jgi:hypothetical protein
MALGQSRAVRAQDQRDVSENRRSRAERLIDHGLFGRVRKVIGASDDVGNAHVDVVNHNAQLVGGKPVRAQQNEILDFGVLELAGAEDGVLKSRRARRWDTKADGPSHSFALASGSLRVGKIAAATGRCFHRFGTFVVAFARLLGVVGSAVHRWLAIAGKGSATGEQTLGRFLVERKALRLKKRPFVPLDSQPLQASENSIDKLGTVALYVSVFDAQDECTAFVSRKKPIEQRGSCTADMEIARRRRCKANARLFGRGHRIFFFAEFILAKGENKIEQHPTRNCMSRHGLVPEYR